ncbi:AAA domain-containing protein [Acetobacter aceti NBRC 14818]|uniref:ParA family protein n=1 Tax=Acetobacter aceti NBRC 14818 TaxID=887700 RepID=A0AB33IJL2_ACEAC|nr:ParA family protein [Acetobacter aceti]TCS32052.1 AAA domain-containing protein [Acetobacter aceti NBRC 14818]BCK77358.1 ParA family protein [Acetobacter aceti NBRC 14818]
MEAYAIWNNKGGTGKSTVTFHVASRFAEKHPDRNVLVIDLCPQANSSMMLLGGGQTGENQLLRLCSQTTPHSVVGYISEAILKRHTPDASDFYVKVDSINDKMPENLYLMSGDGNLEIMASAIGDEANRTPFPGLADPWMWVHEIFSRLLRSLSKDNWTIFIDTNPSFAIYTELAICGATRLLVPVNADDSSRVAVKALFALLYGTTPPHPFFGNYTFAAKASSRSLPIPKFHLAIGNRFTQYKGAAAAFSAFSDATAEQIWTEFQAHPGRFSARTPRPSDRESFLADYVGELRDFNTAGVVAAHHGTPLSKMRQDYYSVHNDPDVKVNRSQINAGLTAVDKLVEKIDP